MSNAQQINVPLIGQTNNVIATLRLQIASQVMAQLAVVDYGTYFRQALDDDKIVGGDGSKLRFGMNNGMVANAAVSYTDALLVALGLARVQE